jgi:hypothetical protein
MTLVFFQVRWKVGLQRLTPENGMREALSVVLASIFLTGVAAAEECAPYCDYRHDYGPFKFTYVQPGSYGYAICASDGDCSPRLVYSASGFRRGRITIQPRLRHATAR